MVISLIALSGALLASIPGSPAHGRNGFPWPDGAYSLVTETQETKGRKLVMTYYVKHLVDDSTGDRVLEFAGLKSMSVNDRELPEEELLRGVLFQPDLDLAADGSIEGIRDRDDVVALWHEMFDALVEAGQLDPKAAAFGKTDEAMDMTLAKAYERYCAWMCAAGEREAERQRLVRRGETPVLGVGFPTRYEVWRDDEPSKPELTVHSRELRDGRDLGPEFKDALLAFGARNGVEPPHQMASAEPTGFAVEMSTTSRHNRSNLLPESVVYTKRVLGDKDAVLSETIVRYDFDWDWPTTILLDRPLPGSPDAGAPSPSQVNHEPEPTSADGSRVASLKSRPPPRYPPSAIRRRESGTTIVRGRVGADGTGRDLVVVQSSGSAALDEAAVESLRHANFHPALEGHAPIESEVEVPTEFRLNEL